MPRRRKKLDPEKIKQQYDDWKVDPDAEAQEDSDEDKEGKEEADQEADQAEIVKKAAKKKKKPNYEYQKLVKLSDNIQENELTDKIDPLAGDLYIKIQPLLDILLECAKTFRVKKLKKVKQLPQEVFKIAQFGSKRQFC